MQRGYRSSGGCTCPAWAGLSQGKGLTEPRDSREESLSMTSKKPVEGKKRSCMSKCLDRKGDPGSCVLFHRASLQVSSCQGHPVPGNVPEIGNNSLVTSTQEDIKEKGNWAEVPPLTSLLPMGQGHQHQPVMLTGFSCAHVSQAHLYLENGFHGILDLVGGCSGKKRGCCYSCYS